VPTGIGKFFRGGIGQRNVTNRKHVSVLSSSVVNQDTIGLPDQGRVDSNVFSTISSPGEG